MRVGNAGLYVTSHYLSGLRDGGSRLSVPVQPSLALYAHYKHVSGTPAGGEQKAVSLARIRLLNRRIETLRNLSRKSSPAKTEEGTRPETEIEALIEVYAAELHQMLASVPETFGTLPGAVSTGSAFNTQA